MSDLSEDVHFTPTTIQEMKNTELNILHFKRKIENEREGVMRWQREYGLPLRPNGKFRYIRIKAAIAILKKEREENDQ